MTALAKIDVLVATVEHSGTHTLLGLLDYEGRQGRMLLEQPSVRQSTHILFTHLWDKEIPRIIEAAKTMSVITTFRPEEDIRASWIRRGKNLELLEKQLVHYAWLLREIKPFVVHLNDRRTA